VGTVTVARAFHVQNEWPRGIGAPPDNRRRRGSIRTRGGPAPMRAYSKNHPFYRFRWFRTTRAGKSPTSACITWTRSTWHSGDAPLAVTAMGGKLVIEDNHGSRTPSKCSGYRAARW
jgi:hypothetical protein